MKKYWISGALVLCAVCVLCSASSGKTDLWPEIEPFRTGFLKVSDIHEIYYELCGNPEGKPVFVLHGGPGGSCSPYMRRFFNPEKFLIVLFDQRGAGKSRPQSELRENTTAHLVEDIEKLRDHLGLDRILLFGGSWGSTLALAYGETYPGCVLGMVLRGIFTATKEEIDFFYHGGVRPFFPEVYESLLEPLRKGDGYLPGILLDRIQNGSPEEKAKISMIWNRYEYKISALEVKDAEVSTLEHYPPEVVYTFALFENHYMANRCFLEEGQLFRDAGRLKDIPVVLVNGRYDMICPPVTAYRLHRLLPKSTLVIVERAGHWMGDPPMETALLEAMRSFEQ